MSAQKEIDAMNERNVPTSFGLSSEELARVTGGRAAEPVDDGWCPFPMPGPKVTLPPDQDGIVSPPVV